MNNQELIAKAIEYTEKNINDIKYFFVDERASRAQLDREAGYIGLPAGSSVEEMNEKIRELLLDPNQWEVEKNPEDWEYTEPEDLENFVFYTGEIFAKPSEPKTLKCVIIYPHDFFSDNIFIEILLDGEEIVAWNLHED